MMILAGFAPCSRPGFLCPSSVLEDMPVAITQLTVFTSPNPDSEHLAPGSQMAGGPFFVAGTAKDQIPASRRAENVEDFTGRFPAQ